MRLFFLFLTFALVASPAVRAEEPLRRREAAAPTAAADDSEGRLAYIQALFERERVPAKWWSFGWQAGFGVIVAGQAIWAGVTDDIDTRRERGVGAGAASIGFISQFPAWLPSRNANARVAALATTDTAERLAFAESILHEGYKRERFTRRILTHLGGLVVAGTSSMVLWQVWDLNTKAAINFPIALSVGQARIWTQPTMSLRTWEAYDAAYGETGDPQKISFHVVPQPRGLGFALTF